LLTYIHFLDKQGANEEAIQLLENALKRTSEDESVPLLYKLASMLEEKNPSKSLTLFNTIFRIDSTYLDTQNRINKLTKLLNKYNINNYNDKTSLDDEDKIHFS